MYQLRTQTYTCEINQEIFSIRKLISPDSHACILCHRAIAPRHLVCRHFHLAERKALMLTRCNLNP